MLIVKIKLFFLLYGLIYSLMGCANGGGSVAGDGLKPTVYYKPTVVAAQTQVCSEVVKLLNVQEQPIVELCLRDYRHCLMQGSCFIQTSNREIQSVNFHSMKNGIARFVEVNLQRCPFGYGVRDICLDPYYSVAADLNFHTPGDVIFVPRAVGVRTPLGEAHDGYFVVRDSGGSIIGEKRFDFFTGFESNLTSKNGFAVIGLGDPKNRFEFRKATGEEAERIRQSRNFPDLNRNIFDFGQNHIIGL